VDPRAVLDDMEKTKFLLYLDSNFDPSVVQHVDSRCTDNAIAAHEIDNMVVFIMFKKYSLRLVIASNETARKVILLCEEQSRPAMKDVTCAVMSRPNYSRTGHVNATRLRSWELTFLLCVRLSNLLTS
jgi:hypothetical protein